MGALRAVLSEGKRQVSQVLHNLTIPKPLFHPWGDGGGGVQGTL